MNNIYKILAEHVFENVKFYKKVQSKDLHLNLQIFCTHIRHDSMKISFNLVKYWDGCHKLSQVKFVY